MKLFIAQDAFTEYDNTAHHMHPTPEPSTYGFILTLLCLLIIISMKLPKENLKQFIGKFFRNAHNLAAFYFIGLFAGVPINLIWGDGSGVFFQVLIMFFTIIWLIPFLYHDIVSRK